jgi:predicted nucleotidyltransferase
MQDEGSLQQAVGRLVRSARGPRWVILFGSYARGSADEGSDVDLRVIEEEIVAKAAEYLRLRSALGRLPVGGDLLLIGADDFTRRSQLPGTVHHQASVEGRVRYDARA